MISLREIKDTERILSCRSLIKADVNFWKEDLKPEEYEIFDEIDDVLEPYANNISEFRLDNDSSDVATTISGYIAKKLIKRSKCDICKKKLKSNSEDLCNDEYLQLLLRGGLFVPSRVLADYVCNYFAALDYVEKDMVNLTKISLTQNALYVLEELCFSQG